MISGVTSPQFPPASKRFPSERSVAECPVT
jgi:hypothetical protein